MQNVSKLMVKTPDFSFIDPLLLRPFFDDANADAFMIIYYFSQLPLYLTIVMRQASSDAYQHVQSNFL